MIHRREVHMTEHVRDAAATALIFGFFASSWFGWAQEAPPARWRPGLLAGAVVALLTAVAGGLLTWRHWGGGTAFDRDTSIAFGIVVGIEVALAGLGAAVLALRRRAALIPAWIALVVGLHFFPLAVLLEYPFLYVVAAVVTAGAVAAVPLARRRGVPVSAVTGAVTGAALLAAALVSLAIALFSD
jgi:hypothetical protein